MNHWHTRPEIDFRTYLTPERRGRLNPGHRGVDEASCPACKVAAEPEVAPVRKNRRKSKAVYTLLPEEVTLKAAETVAQSNKGIVNLSDLLIAVWKLAPSLFGLPGYRDQHPDSNKLLNCVDIAQCKDWLRLKESHVWTIGAHGCHRLHELSRANVRMPR
jgi:hypothetical protein